MSGNDLTSSDLTIKTELFVLKNRLIRVLSSVHLTNFAETEFVSFQRLIQKTRSTHQHQKIKRSILIEKNKDGRPRAIQNLDSN